ncbi:mitogen-activated protein kinase kinase kinase 11-like [Paramacrobiotus metropolitanus]|uniref:mitogen-activated protein kinase kinase kinase 11-like n=1 Tax=Paramacrobiotus metropolitanus TaxID=2943436 RepID=UPI0024460E45|nr:mitogen-activated protein kinase kinase kinase 11-like [Paramacrobiotus metropolitanus]
MAGQVYEFTEADRVMEYKLTTEIGHGRFGQVWEASEWCDGRSTNRAVAVKITEHVLDIGTDKAQLRENIEDRLRRIRSIRSDNVVAYYHTRVDDTDNGFDAILQTTIVMEYCTFGSLDSLLRSAPLTNEEIKDLIQQTLTGVVAIHALKIVHCDLKPANIVLAYDASAPYHRRAKITDLDDHLALLTSTVTLLDLHAPGTVRYMAPEMMRGYSAGKKSDMWSVGCILVDMYRHEQPVRFVKLVEGKTVAMDALVVGEWMGPTVLMKYVGEGGTPEIPNRAPVAARCLLSQCFKMNPKERISAADMLSSEWLQQKDSLSPTVPETVQDASHVENTREFLLNNGDDIPAPDKEMQWDVGVNCGARVLMHHREQTHFPVAYYHVEIERVKKNVDPGKPLDEKFRAVLRRHLDPGQRAAGPVNVFADLLCRGVTYLAQPGTSRFSAGISLFIPTLGPSFPDVAKWMNAYTRDYQYVCRGHATWADIRPLLDRGEPVMAQVCWNDRPMDEGVRQIAVAAGYGAVFPPTHPNIGAVVLRGYEGGGAGEPRTVTFTHPFGDTRVVRYADFKQYANWMPEHPVTKEVFELAGYEPGQIIYRVKRAG